MIGLLEQVGFFWLVGIGATGVAGTEITQGQEHGRRKERRPQKPAQMEGKRAFIRRKGGVQQGSPHVDRHSKVQRNTLGMGARP